MGLTCALRQKTLPGAFFSDFVHRHERNHGTRPGVEDQAWKQICQPLCTSNPPPSQVYSNRPHQSPLSDEGLELGGSSNIDTRRWRLRRGEYLE